MHWPMYDNRKLNNCSMVAAAHLIGFCTGTFPSEEDVVRAFEEMTGGQNTEVNELTALNHWRDKGIGGHKIKDYTVLDLDNFSAFTLKRGIYTFAQIPESLTIKDRVWSIAPGPTSGHFFATFDFDINGPICASWGAQRNMTWPFWDQCVKTAVVCHL